jgi:hypothetical protein
MAAVIILLVDKTGIGKPIVAVRGRGKSNKELVTTGVLERAIRFRDIENARKFLTSLRPWQLGDWRPFFVPADGESAVPIEEMQQV